MTTNPRTHCEPWLLVGCLAALGLTGCPDADAASVPDSDAGAGGSFDGGTRPPPSEPDDPSAGDAYAPLPLDPADPGPRDGFESADGFSDGRTRVGCYDRTGDDCAQAACATLRSCCVGHGDCCGPAPEVRFPLRVDFTDCAASPAACLAADAITATPFGDPLPFVQSAALAPGGDGDDDSGLVLDPALDLRAHRVALEATFRAPDACEGSCLEGVGVSLTAQAAFDETTTVLPLVGLVLRGARQEVALVIDGVVVGSAPMTSAVETWTLTVRPTGDVTAGRPGEAPLRGDAPLTSAARVVIHGRSRNPAADAGASAALVALSTTVELCDIPAGWTTREAVALRDRATGPVPTDGAGGPSIAYRDGRAALAFARGGAIYLAERPDAVPWEFTRATLDAALVPEEGEVLSDPELQWDATGNRWVLYYVSERAGTSVIARATMRPAETRFVREGEVTSASRMGIARVDGPTVLEHPEGPWLLMLRFRREDGVTGIAAMRSSDRGITFREVDMAMGPALAALAADEIADPSLVAHDGAYQLYLSRRRGTRWGTALLTSHELVWWRPLDDGGAILTGHVDAERLGVRGADATSVGERIELVHVGLDGLGTTLRWAARPATDDGTL